MLSCRMNEVAALTKISQRCQYALRAVYGLAKEWGGEPVPVSRIAIEQAIPQRFLELICRDLRTAGIIKSHRGPRGGYTLQVAPDALTVGRVIQLFDGAFAPVDCELCGGKRYCPLKDRCAFAGLWRRAQLTAAQVYNSTTFQHLLDEVSNQGEGGRPFAP